MGNQHSTSTTSSGSRTSERAGEPAPVAASRPPPTFALRSPAAATTSSSSSSAASPSLPLPLPLPLTQAHPQLTNPPAHRKEPRRRESLQGLSGGVAVKAPPSASPSLQQATASLHQVNATPSHARSRSQPHATPLFRPTEYDSGMGNEQSSHSGDHRRRHQQHPTSAAAPAPFTTDSAAVAAVSAVAAPHTTSSQAANLSPPPPPSAPVAVPVAGGSNPALVNSGSRFEPPPEPILAPVEQYSVPSAQFIRPPRLPLPIQEEEYVPGSPVISPEDIVGPIEPIGGEATLPRGTSILSSAADEDDELEYDFQNIDPGAQRMVPTTIEWSEGGEKVYVTGTFASNWAKKLRLVRDGPSPNKDAFSATVGLLPGQHHLRFIVDGEMVFSKYLPTTVDDANILVNYIEVSADELPPLPDVVPAAGTNATDVAAQVQKSVAPPEGVQAPDIVTPAPDAPPQSDQPEEAQPSYQPSAPTPIALIEPKIWHTSIPSFLADLDAPEDTSKFARASAAINAAPPPPSLPMFLGKSILNSTGPVRDDNSVLIIPNHTVLNHLATSSIRNGVLGVSGTTRYKRKFLTSIMYKPTNELVD